MAVTIRIKDCRVWLYRKITCMLLEMGANPITAYMYRECDYCKSIFKVTRVILARLNKGEEQIIYCPFCNDKSNHEVKQEKFLTSLRGYIK